LPKRREFFYLIIFRLSKARLGVNGQASGGTGCPGGGQAVRGRLADEKGFELAIML
jgi:hypothetical protein